MALEGVHLMMVGDAHPAAGWVEEARYATPKLNSNSQQPYSKFTRIIGINKRRLRLKSRHDRSGLRTFHLVAEFSLAQ